MLYLLTTGINLALNAVGVLRMGGLSSVTANSVRRSVKIMAEEAAKLTAWKASEALVKKTIEKTAEKFVI